MSEDQIREQFDHEKALTDAYFDFRCLKAAQQDKGMITMDSEKRTFGNRVLDLLLERAGNNGLNPKERQQVVEGISFVRKQIRALLAKGTEYGVIREDKREFVSMMEEVFADLFEPGLPGEKEQSFEMEILWANIKFQYSSILPWLFKYGYSIEDIPSWPEIQHAMKHDDSLVGEALKMRNPCLLLSKLVFSDSIMRRACINSFSKNGGLRFEGHCPYAHLLPWTVQITEEQ